jgi:hypothetical protein
MTNGGTQMKHFILFLLACVMISGMVFTQETANPKELIIGKWKNANNIIYEFTVDKKVLVGEKEYATFRFLEGVLVLTYLDKDIDFYAGLEFADENHMTLTEYKDQGDKEKIMLFSRLE